MRRISALCAAISAIAASTSVQAAGLLKTLLPAPLPAHASSLPALPRVGAANLGGLPAMAPMATLPGAPTESGGGRVTRALGYELRYDSFLVQHAVATTPAFVASVGELATLALAVPVPPSIPALASYVPAVLHKGDEVIGGGIVRGPGSPPKDIFRNGVIVPVEILTGTLPQ